MNVTSVLLLGALMGSVSGASVFFVKDEENKLSVFLASVLRNILLGLLIGFTLEDNNTLIRALLFGALYGLLSGLVVFLVQGGFKKKEHLPIIYFSIAIGIVLAVLIWKFGMAAAELPLSS